MTLSGWSHQVEASKHCPRKMGWQFLASPNLICKSLKGEYFSGIHSNSYCKGCSQYARLCLLWWTKGFKRSIWHGRLFGFLGTPCLLHTSQSFMRMFSSLSFIGMIKTNQDNYCYSIIMVLSEVKPLPSLNTQQFIMWPQGRMWSFLQVLCFGFIYLPVSERLIWCEDAFSNLSLSQEGEKESQDHYAVIPGFEVFKKCT